MASILSGCSSHRHVIREPQPVKYGVPQEILDKQKPVVVFDTIPQAETDTINKADEEFTFDEPLPPVPDIPVCKYGPPGGNW